ncbi:MAG: metal ABC transporter permease [Yaniella sp.]|uniref:metal ABC transporter permease n=2 Tax=Yaniella sp. TaxID=2773929 RepID=UPI002648F32B|nr:metal ABC transporter permease [Yaniella sp.]MDN5815125.1 metal ABC transporter permease [Yaniella sp.]MDN5889177.1 metal ABC transporter permease [Yaniella sp.]MDN6147927.1 metal ABC transporter permease [Yaniella sp.]MDN6151188.1 metal ABC transporter permease [Yaniella sp.]MDN6358097.1 metal ABC transporter permease [Yaniella sp.]
MELYNWMVEPFQAGFQIRALLGGLLAAVMSSFVGVWLVLRGMSFFGDAFVHGVVPGIAAAVLFDFSPFLGAALAALVMVSLLELIHRTTSLKEDSAIGLLFVGMMALGVVLISRSDSFQGSLTAILFGDALGVSWADVGVQLMFVVGVGLMSLLLYRPLMVLSFSPDKSQALGMRPQLTHWLLLLMIAAAVIGSFQAVGTLLVLGLLIGPAAAAALITRTVPRMILTSLLLGMISVTVGLILSYHLGTAAGASMALVAILGFFIILTIRETVAAIVRRKRSTTLVEQGAS